MMSGFHPVHQVGHTVTVHDGETELFRYVYRPETVQRESPKPYFHPLRTRAGNLVSLTRPHDHVWHTGLAWALPVVNEENFWGGNSYVPGRGYLQLDNNGAQRQVGDLAVAVRSGSINVQGSTSAQANEVVIEHQLRWITQAGECWFTEERTITASPLNETAWALTFDTSMRNVSGRHIVLGSPTTKGRDNAGYGGLFWRGPRSFTDGVVVAPRTQGPGSALRGQRHEWMGYIGQHDEVDATSVVVMVDHPGNVHHPPQWFVRSEEFAALGPAPFFSEEVQVRDGETIRFRVGVGIADAANADNKDAENCGVEDLAALVRTRLKVQR